MTVSCLNPSFVPPSLLNFNKANNFLTILAAVIFFSSWVLHTTITNDNQSYNMYQLLLSLPDIE